jgi:hypothetical protein
MKVQDIGGHQEQEILANPQRGVEIAAVANTGGSSSDGGRSLCAENSLQGLSRFL